MTDKKEYRVKLKDTSYQPTKYEYIKLLLKIVMMFFSYFHNGMTFITTMVLSYNCYYDSYMISNEDWKFYASIMLFFSLFKVITMNFIFFSNFIYYNRLEKEKEILKAYHFLILRTLYLKKMHRFKFLLLFIIFNLILPFIIGIFDILFYCNSSNIRLLMRLYCIKDGANNEDIKKRYYLTYKIMFIGLLFLDIPSAVISIKILSSKNNKIIDYSLTSSNLSAIYCLIRISYTIVSNIYSILTGMYVINWIKNICKKSINNELQEPLHSYN